MPKAIIRFVLFCFFLVTLVAKADDHEVLSPSGAISGEDFLQMSDGEKSVYALGLSDGMLSAPLFGADFVQAQRFQNCLLGMTSNQLSAILEKRLRSIPENWHFKANGLQLWFALKKNCPALGDEKRKE